MFLEFLLMLRDESSAIKATHVVAYAPLTASLRGRAPPAAAVPNRQNVTVPSSTTESR